MPNHRSLFPNFLVLATLVSACSSDEDPGNASDNLNQGDAGDAGGAGGGGTPNLPALPDDVALPIVFVHGFAGSAQQYQSQAMRFVANGYPQERIIAYDHDGQGLDYAAYVAGTDAVVEQAREQFGVDKVYLVGHSRGTIVSTQYLTDPTLAPKIAKYISLDGAGCAAAMTASIPCIAPHQAGAPGMADPDLDHAIPGQAHVEIATSAESFAMQYEFLVGEPPEVVDIVRQSDPVEISGRVVEFPLNTGRDGTTLEIWEVDSDTGLRVDEEPLATFDIGPDGSWGPVTVSPDKHYEKALLNPNGGMQHFYMQPYLRSSHLVRLLSQNPETSTIRANTNGGDHHAALTAIRMREWYATGHRSTPGEGVDILEIETNSESGNAPAVNAISAKTTDGNIAIHIHDDAATPGESTDAELPNLAGAFQSTADVYMPAADPPDGTITFTNYPRGDRSRPQVINAANWSSTNHILQILYSDFAQD